MASKGAVKLELLFASLGNEMETLAARSQGMFALNNQLVAFNAAFKDLLGAVDLHTGCFDYPRVRDVCPPTPTPVKAAPEEREQRGGKGTKRRQAAKKKAKTAKKKKKKSRIPNVDETRLPAKYNTEDGRDVLNTVLKRMYEAGEAGLAIGDVVETVDVNLLRAKELLGVLQRTGKVERSKGDQGFVFSLVKQLRKRVK